MRCPASTLVTPSSRLTSCESGCVRRDTWEPRRNLDSWQDSYDDDLKRIAARDPQKADLKALQAEADRKNAAWRQKEAAKAQKKLAKKSAKIGAHKGKVVENLLLAKGKDVAKDKVRTGSRALANQFSLLTASYCTTEAKSQGRADRGFYSEATRTTRLRQQQGFGVASSRRDFAH